MILEPHLKPRAANYAPLTPLDFLDRAITDFPERRAVVWREHSWTYAGFAGIVQRMAEALRVRGIGPDNVVSVMLSNRPEMLAAHYAVPLVGAVLNTINTRLDASSVAHILRHAGSKIIIVDRQVHDVAFEAALSAHVKLICVSDGPDTENSDEEFNLLQGDPATAVLEHRSIKNEWQPICLNYTSGTTGQPKGVVYTHRGAYINALGNVLALGFDRHTTYLWTLPMFHCNGWCHTWAVTAAGGTHVCLDRPDPVLIFAEIAAHEVTHLACAPVVLHMMLNSPARQTRNPEKRLLVATGGAAPTTSLIEHLEVLGFDFTHLYGLTECYGPASINEIDKLDGGDLDPTEKARILARQGVRHITANHLLVLDNAQRSVPKDGKTIGEICLRGNTLMAGYYRDASATEAAFAGDVFHTGDLAVRHPNGQIEIKDRSKDVIISGGENISSLEIENVLQQHPDISLSAVVAAPDTKWGEVPCAFIETERGSKIEPEELKKFCKERLPGFKVPRIFVFRKLPKTATGKIQKFMLREIAKNDQTWSAEYH